MGVVYVSVDSEQSFEDGLGDGDEVTREGSACRGKNTPLLSQHPILKVHPSPGSSCGLLCIYLRNGILSLWDIQLSFYW